MLSWARSSRGFVAMGTVAALIAASLGVMLGSGASRSLFDLGDGLAWLGSAEPGELLLVDAGSGEGVGRLPIDGAAGQSMSVVHRGGVAYVTVGGRELYRVDPASALAKQDLIEGQRIVRGGERAYLVNELKGTVRQVDPTSLKVKGRELSFDAPVRAEADGEGRLIVAEVARGRVHVVTGTRSGSPVQVADGAVKLVGAGDVPTVVDVKGRAAYAFDGGDQTKVRLPDPGGRDVLVPRTADTTQVGILGRSAGQGSLVMVNVKNGVARRMSVDTDVSGMDAPFVSKRAVYLVDRSRGRVVVVDPVSGAVRREHPDVRVGKGDGLDIFLKDGFLWVNNPDGKKAVVVSSDGSLKDVDKYDTKGVPVVGGDTPETPIEVAAGTRKTPDSSDTLGQGGAVSPASSGWGDAPLPVAGAPGQPGSFEATAGNRTVNLSWVAPTDGGSRISGYRIRCTPGCGTAPSVIPDNGNPGSKAFSVEGLRNGTEYRFELQAVNSVPLTGPNATAGPITPTADVPSPPTNINAALDPQDGSVQISWDAADGEGRDIIEYVVTATDIASGVSADVGRATSIPNLRSDAGVLPFGTEQTFNVIAVNDLGRASKPASSKPISIFAAPKAPTPRIAAVNDGSVDLEWDEPQSNGSAVNNYEIEVDGRIYGQTSATRTTVDGLRNGKPAEVRVRAANNESNWGDWSINALEVTAHAGAPSVDAVVTRLDIDTVKVEPQVSWVGRPGTLQVNGQQTSGERQLDFRVGTTGRQVTVRACVDDFDDASCVDRSFEVDLRAPVIVWDVIGFNTCNDGGIPVRAGATWGANWRIETYGLPAAQFSNGKNTAVYDTIRRETFPKTWTAQSLVG